MSTGFFTAACPECGWEPAGKEARSMVRRSLARHLQYEHDMGKDAAWKLAFEIVPRQPDERAPEAPRRKDELPPLTPRA